MVNQTTRPVSTGLANKPRLKADTKVTSPTHDVEDVPIYHAREVPGSTEAMAAGEETTRAELKFEWSDWAANTNATVVKENLSREGEYLTLTLTLTLVVGES